MSIAYKLKQGAMSNENYRYIVHTTPNLQLVLMSLLPGQDIPMEVHDNATQMVYIVKGKCKAIVADKTYIVEAGETIIVPPNTPHHLINNSTGKLKLFTVYSPPQHH